MRRFLSTFFALFLLGFSTPLAFSADVSSSSSAGSAPSAVVAPQGFGVLPGGEGFKSNTLTEKECFGLVEEWTEGYYAVVAPAGGSNTTGSALPSSADTTHYGTVAAGDMMACAIKSGNMHIWMLPYFVNYALDFLIRLAGIVTVLLVVVGGYYYVVGSVTEDTDTGKTIIKNALIGYAVILVAWFVVNAVLIAVTQ